MGTWIEDALHLDRTVAGLSEPDRRKTLAKVASDEGVAFETVVRRIRAARYIDKQLTETEVKIADVKASTIAVRNLMTLERRDPRKASEVFLDVLSGKMTSRQIMRLATEAAGPVTKASVPMHEVLVSVLHATERYSRGNFGSMSENAKLAKTDIELFGSDKATVASVYLSPKISLSNFHGRPAADQAPYVFMSCCLFEQTFYFYTNSAEQELFERLIAASKIGLNFTAIDFAEAYSVVKIELSS